MGARIVFNGVDLSDFITHDDTINEPPDTMVDSTAWAGTITGIIDIDGTHRCVMCGLSFHPHEFVAIAVVRGKRIGPACDACAIDGLT